MFDSDRFLPTHDAHDPSGDPPDHVYISRLNLVLVGDRVFLADDTSHPDIRDEIRRIDPEIDDMIIWALSRAEAVDFASYMDWEDVCEAMPEGHPIIAVPVPYMRAFELPSVDPRLAAFDFNREPMERLVRLASVLSHAGRVGVPAETLIEVADFDGDKDLGSQLNRELKYLRALGWDITNIAANGQPGRYRMTGVDNRLRVALTPAQQSALRRAVLVANRRDLVERLGLPGTDTPDEVPTVMDMTST